MITTRNPATPGLLSPSPIKPSRVASGRSSLNGRYLEVNLATRSSVTLHSCSLRRGRKLQCSSRSVAMASSSGVQEKSGRKLQREHVLKPEQISQAKSAIDRFIQGIASHPERREGAYPYYLFHKPGDKVYGTVLLFHGFSAKPDQLWRLAQYLFDNGFNVYQPCIYNHWLVNPDKNWAQVDLKPRWKGPVRARFLNDPVLKSVIDNIGNIKDITPAQSNDILKRVYDLSPDMDDIVDAIDDGAYSEPFQKYYDSTHMKYLEDAEARLNECKSLPGPAFTVGLSVGGAVALGLAERKPDRVARVVAYAPLLKQVGEARRQATLIAGPLDVKETGWDPNLQFTVGCFAATDVFGNHVLQEENALTQVPTFLMLTENEDSADIATNKNFTQRLKSSAGAKGAPHLEAMYSANLKVSHPMVDPLEVSQGMKNKYWTTLYQETFRFLTEARINVAQLSNASQDPSLPKVPPV